MSLALLFGGQGLQHSQMLPWLETCPESATTLALVNAQLGADWRTRLAEPKWAQCNAVAQPLLTGLGIAAWEGLAPQLPAPAVVAGYSVGEVAAFCVAGAINADEAMALVQDRAAAMDRCVAGCDTGLLAVHGLSLSALDAACARFDLSVAIRLATDRVVLGGASETLEAAEAELSAQGVHCTRLAVRIASHTPWMESAALEFETRLSAVAVRSPRSVLVCNYSGVSERDPLRLKQLLARQLAATVRWDACLDTIFERRVRCVLEIGPGNALANLWRDRHPDVPVRSADEFRSAHEVARWVNLTLK